LEVEKVKLCLLRSERKHRLYFFRTDKPVETLQRLKEACKKIVLPPAKVSDVDDFTFVIGSPAYGKISVLLGFAAVPEKNKISVLLRKGDGELWLSNVFRELDLEFQFESLEERKLRRLRESLTELDYKILEMRSKGLSLWTIASTLGVTLGKVRYSLQKLSLFPEYAEKLGAFKPLSWSERFKAKTS